MHPVMTDNLEDHAVKAQAVVDSKSDRSKTFDFVLSGYRLFRNLAVLIACGLIEFPKETAQAILSYSSADLRETFPMFYRCLEQETELVDLDAAIDDGAEFSDTLLSYVDGFPMLRILKPGATISGEFMDDTLLSVREDDEEDEDTAGEVEDDSPIQCGNCCSSDEGFPVLSRKTLQETEDGLNAAHRDRWGEEPSPAQEDYNRLHARVLCGVAMSAEDFEFYGQLHTMMVQEAVERIVNQKAFEARRAATIESGNQARVAETVEACDCFDCEAEFEATCDRQGYSFTPPFTFSDVLFVALPESVRNEIMDAGGYSFIETNLTGRCYSVHLTTGVIVHCPWGGLVLTPDMLAQSLALN